MFGTGLTIRDEFENIFINYRDESGLNAETRWVDRVTYDGTWENNLFNFFRKVMPKLTENIKKPFVLKNQQSIEYGESCGSMNIQYLNTEGDLIKYDGHLYKQEDGSMAIYDDINGLLGMVTIANGKAKITGSTFDGEYPCKELYTS